MRDHLTKESGLMDISEVINRVIAAIMLATLTGLAGAVLAAQSDLTTSSDQDNYGGYGEPDQVGTLDTEDGPTVTGGTSGSGAGTSGQRRGFTVTELTVGTNDLRRGGSQLRWIRIANPHDGDIVVTKISADVGLPAVHGRKAHGTCLPQDLAVDPLPGPITVPAKDFVELALVARLDAAAPAACTDAYFPITFSGVASTA